MKTIELATLADAVPMTRFAGTGSGYVYFAKSERGPIKVGFSGAPTRRVCNLNSAPEREVFAKRHGFDHGKVRLVFAVHGCRVQHERAVHRHLRANAIGFEWFRGSVASDLVAQLLPFAVERPAGFRSEGHRLLVSAIQKTGGELGVSSVIGCAQSTVSHWAVGNTVPSGDMRAVIEARLDIPCSAWLSPPSEAA